MHTPMSLMDKAQALMPLTSHSSTSAIRHHCLALKNGLLWFCIHFPFGVLSQFSFYLLWWRWSGRGLFLFFIEKPAVIGRVRFWQGNKRRKFSVCHHTQSAVKLPVCESGSEKLNLTSVCTYTYTVNFSRQKWKNLTKGGHSHLNLFCSKVLDGWNVHK